MNRLTATNRLNDGGRLLVENPQAADLDAPLTNSIIPQRGVGAVSYTRATIATVTDHEGVMRKCIAGEARFLGARRIHNLTTYSQKANSWSQFSVTVSGTKVAYTDGSLIGQTVVSAAASASHYIANGIGPVIIGNTYLFSVSVKAAGANFVQLAFAASTTYQNFDLTNGSMGGTPGAGSVVDEGNGWYRCTVKFVSTLGTNAGQGIVIVSSINDVWLQPNLGDGVSGVSVCRMQLEDVTGQSIQTPGEYVSTNVLTNAPFHGSNVDGVKCFKTTLAGLPISPSTLKGYLCEGQRTNICNYSNIAVAGWGLIGATRTNNAGIAPDGTNSMVKIIPNAGTQQSYIQNTTVTATATVHTISCFVKADGFNFIQLRTTSGLSGGYANYNLSNGTVGTFATWTNAGIDTTPLPGVYRIWTVTDTLTAGTGSVIAQVINSSTDTKGASVTGNGTNGILIWGMQIEAGVNVSTYIPTVASTVTRNIDVLTYGVKNVIANQGALSSIIHLNDSAQFDRRAAALSSFTVNRLHVHARSGGSSDLGIVYGDGVTVRQVTGAAAGTNNIAVSWKNGVWLNLYMNNIKYIGEFVPSLAFTIIDVGGGTVGYPLFGCVKNVRIWKTLPTDAELLALSNSSY